MDENFTNHEKDELRKLRHSAFVESFEHHEAKPVHKDQWGNEIEFLLSCITLSVGLGNVWR